MTLTSAQVDDFYSGCQNFGQCHHRYSSSQDYISRDDHTLLTYDPSPGSKPLTVFELWYEDSGQVYFVQ